MRIRYWPFIHSSFSSSKTAGALCTSLRSKIAAASSGVISSRSPPGDHPSSIRKLNRASGTMPRSRYSSAEVAPLLVGAEDQREMGEHRRLAVERAKQQDVLRRVGEMVVAARDVGDLHVDVIDDDGEVVRRIAVGANENEVVDLLRVEMDIAANQIVKVDGSFFDLEADDVRLSLRLRCAGVRLRAAAAGVAIGLARSL